MTLERRLTSVFISKTHQGNKRPLLLKDLIKTAEIECVFGKNVVQVLVAYCGSPLGLNIRNLLWHGFSVDDDSHMPLPLINFTGVLLWLVMFEFEECECDDWML